LRAARPFAYCFSSNPISAVLPCSTTGRLITVGFSSISAMALFSSLTFACADGGSIRQVVPRRLSTVSHPKRRHQRSSSSRVGGVFLKSTNS